MVSERELIYTLWDTVRAGEFNQDDNINERLMRQYLSAHRGKILDQVSSKGALLPEEVFQSLGTINFSFTGGVYVSPQLPKIIRFRHNYGIACFKGPYIISIMNSEEFDNAKYDQFNKFHPRLKFINRKLTFDLGNTQVCNQIEDLSNSVLNTAVRLLNEESKTNSVKITGMGALVRTDDEVGYDWLSDPYPMPDELIEQLMNSVSARDFNIFLKMRSDETGDSQNTTEPYDPNREI